MKQIPILLISLYRRLISPLLPDRCKYYPSCSAYSLEAFREWGFFRGTGLTVWRLLRCNPLSLGGFDPVRRRSESRADYEARKGHDRARSAHTCGHDYGREAVR